MYKKKGPEARPLHRINSRQEQDDPAVGNTGMFAAKLARQHGCEISFLQCQGNHRAGQTQPQFVHVAFLLLGGAVDGGGAFQISLP